MTDLAPRVRPPAAGPTYGAGATRRGRRRRRRRARHRDRDRGHHTGQWYHRHHPGGRVRWPARRLDRRQGRSGDSPRRSTSTRTTTRTSSSTSRPHGGQLAVPGGGHPRPTAVGPEPTMTRSSEAMDHKQAAGAERPSPPHAQGRATPGRPRRGSRGHVAGDHRGARRRQSEVAPTPTAGLVHGPRTMARAPRHRWPPRAAATATRPRAARDVRGHPGCAGLGAVEHLVPPGRDRPGAARRGRSPRRLRARTDRAGLFTVPPRQRADESRGRRRRRGQAQPAARRAGRCRPGRGG